MKPWMKTTLCISLSLMCLFSCIGYAALAENLGLSGSAGVEAVEPQGIYISRVELYSRGSGISDDRKDILLPTNLSTNLRVGAANASVTYEITVTNKTAMTYWYLGPEIVTEVGSNSLINVTNGIVITTKDGSASNSTLFDIGDWVPPYTERTFYATYVFGSRAQGDISTLVNFNFGLHVASVSDAFLKVLNDGVSVYGYHYLADAFDQNYAKNGSTVVANVGKDEEVFNSLFGDSLTVNVNGEDLPVTIVVERQNVDGKSGSGDAYSNNGPSGCEYTVYISVEDLSGNGKVTVYAVSYTCGADGVWYMIGELYEGTCTAEQYENSSVATDRAFDVDTWIAVKKDYSVTDDISYKVGYEQGTTYDKYNTIEQLMSASDTEFYNKVNNNSGKLLKPVCNVLYTYRHNNGQYIESENSANMFKQGYAALKAAFDRIKPYCLIANGAQEVKIQNANSLSRAELIQLLEEIQRTYDYYMAVNPNG